MTESLQQRLLRVQRTLEAYDQHHEDCNCSFCDAVTQLEDLRGILRREKAAAA